MSPLFVALAGVVSLFAGSVSPAHAAGAKPRPNIVFILADDLGVKDLGNEGSVFYESPHIDRISELGMKFTRGYATCQVCSPSRASILTGKYPVNVGITTWIGDGSGPAWRGAKRFDSHLPAEYEHQLRASELTLAEVLRSAGYRTFFAGKWHLGDKGSWPEDHGFDINRGGWRVGGPTGGYFSPYQNPNLPDGPPGESLPIRLGQETAAFIEANHDRPFLAYLSFYSVHGPIQTSSKLWRKYRDKAVSAGEAQRESLAANGLPPRKAGERFVFDRRLAVRQVQDCPIYAGMIESMDNAVGIVLAKLEQHGLLENTIICFTSDNGGVSSGDAFSTSNLPYRGGKGRQWEGGIREPFYLYAPGVTQPGATCDVPVSGIDWYPTLLTLAGVPVPAEQRADGVSLVPLLQGASLPARPLYWHYPHYGNQGGEPSSILMDGDWKLIYYHEDERYELYNVANDVGERHDVLADQPDRARAMQSQLQAWLRETNAKLPAADPQFDAKKRQSRWDMLKTSGQAKLEAQHARFLQEDFSPNDNWWGSALAE
ncbi:MAG: sulfatase [Planctomycetales bacterium]|nr:sulfatase [Planctomycetales bacterium]